MTARVLLEIRLKPHVPVIFFSNKMDLPQAGTVDEVVHAVGIRQMAGGSRPYNIV